MRNPNDDGINLSVKLLNGDVIKIPNKIDVKKTSVLRLKEIISGLCNIPVFEIRLVWKDKILCNTALLNSYAIEDDSILILARSPPRNSNSSSQSSSSNMANARPESTGMFPDPNSNDFISSALASPWVQNILNDTEVVRSLLESNPQLKALREQNPELNHIFNDPQFLQMSIDVMKNPELMKEMMRNSDRAISNIESIPGGFSALKRMYHSVQEPIWDATTYNPNASKSNTYNEYNIDKSSGPNSEALPNPWSNSDNVCKCGCGNSYHSTFYPHDIFGGRYPLPPGMFPLNSGAHNPAAGNTNDDHFLNDNNMLFPGMPGFGNYPNFGALNHDNIHDYNLINNNDHNHTHDHNNIHDHNHIYNHGHNNNTAPGSNGGNSSGSNNNSQPLPLLPNMNVYHPHPFISGNPNTIQTVIDAMRNMNIHNNSGNNVFQNQVNVLLRNRNNMATNINTGNILQDINTNLDNLLNSGNPPAPTNNSEDQHNMASQTNSATNHENNDGGNQNNYNYQLQVLSNMGFTDTEACIKALTESNGSINRAIDKLLNPN